MAAVGSDLLELSAVEDGLKEAVDSAEANVTSTQVAITNIATMEASLDSKL